MKMRTPQLIAAALMGVVALATTVAQAQETMTPLVKQMYDGGWPDKAAVEQLNQERLYQRGIEAYIQRCPSSIPSVCATARRRSSARATTSSRMSGKTWVPTPNCDVIYSMSYLDLKETGPLVVYAPGRSKETKS